MKAIAKIVSFLSVIIALFPSHVVAQDTVFGVFPNYYYNWYEYWPQAETHNNTTFCGLFLFALHNVYNYNPNGCFDLIGSELEDALRHDPQEIAIEMHPDSSLKITGITCAYPLFRGGFAGAYINPVISPSDITAHFNVYDKNMALLYTQSTSLANFDTSRYIEFGVEKRPDLSDCEVSSYFPLYAPMFDFFFDTTLT